MAEAVQRKRRVGGGPPHLIDESAPFRGDLLSADRLADEARVLASLQESTTQPPVRTTPLLALAARAAESLAADNATLASAAREQLSISPASEWLLDNYYLIEEQILSVRQDLPAHYGVELSRLTSGQYAGYPRVFEAAVDLLVHTDARIDEQYLLRYVDAYQDVSPLAIGEVWAVPIMLRLALVENLRRLSRAVVESHMADQTADAWAERIVLAVEHAPEDLPVLLRQLDEESADAIPAFYVRLAQRLGGLEAGGEQATSWLGARLGALGIVLEEHAHLQQQEQAANQISIANSITSIRFLDAFEWKAFFEEVSLVEQGLREDPAGVYDRMDFASRDRCRHAIEKMARRCDLTELELVEAALSFASEALAREPSDHVRGHVAYYLVSAGRYELEPAVGYRPTATRAHLSRTAALPWTHLRLAARRDHGVDPGGSPSGGSHSPEARRSALVVAALLAVIPLSELALGVTNRILAALYPPRPLLKLDFVHPIAESNRTLVVVPALLSSVAIDAVDHGQPRDLLPREPRPQHRVCPAGRPQGLHRAPAETTTGRSSRRPSAASANSTTATPSSTACARSTCSSEAGRSTSPRGCGWAGSASEVRCWNWRASYTARAAPASRTRWATRRSGAT